MQTLPAVVARSDVHLLVRSSRLANILSLRFGHEKISTAILSLPLILERQQSLASCHELVKECALRLINCLGGLPRNSVDRLTDHAGNDLKSVEGP